MSRVRAPGGALEGTVFEDLRALGTVLFFCTFGSDGGKGLDFQGYKVWRRIVARMSLKKINGKLYYIIHALGGYMVLDFHIYFLADLIGVKYIIGSKYKNRFLTEIKRR